MEKYVLVAVAGRTDPIRSEHDGPILHIIRNYHPEKVYIILSKEIGDMERQYHYLEDAVNLMPEKCQVCCLYTDIEKPHSYDDFSEHLMKICNRVKAENPDHRILLNITSGTPQMETAMCMIGISDSERCLPVQVSTPARSSNHSAAFMPGKDSVADWFETNMDNLEGFVSRCGEPKLLNFKRPLISFQILSLIQNYDYAGACQLYKSNRALFSSRTGALLEHGKRRLNLEFTEAKKKVRKFEYYGELYPLDISNKENEDMEELTEYFNSMKAKQYRGELNDFVLRLEVLTEYLAIYILKHCMGISLESITNRQQKNGSDIVRLDQGKCTSIPGLTNALENHFAGGYRWNSPISSLIMLLVLKHLCSLDRYSQYMDTVNEMMKWRNLAEAVRNPVAHTIVSISENKIRGYYGATSLVLCEKIEAVMVQVFGEKQDESAVQKAFQVYETLQRLVKAEMENV